MLIISTTLTDLAVLIRVPSKVLRVVANSQSYVRSMLGWIQGMHDSVLRQRTPVRHKDPPLIILASQMSV